MTEPTSRPRGHRRRWRDLLGPAAGVGLLTAGILLWSQGPAPLAADVGELPPEVTGAAPAAEPPPAPATGAGDRRAVARGDAPRRAERVSDTITSFVPERLRVPAADLDLPVVPVDVEDGVLGVPDDPRIAGWWEAGARPGSGVGNVVLDGHVDSATYGRGPLRRAVELEPGDPAVLSGLQGRAQRYEVTAVRTIVKAQLPSGIFSTSGPERLVLVTCGGSYDRDRGGWDSNVVVVMEPVGGPSTA